jgi:hypothetical protein
MKKLISTIALAAFPIALFAQEAAQKTEAQVPAAPKGVGEYFGMSDGALFSFMTTIIILLAIGVTIMFTTLKTLLKSDELSLRSRVNPIICKTGSPPFPPWPIPTA